MTMRLFAGGLLALALTATAIGPVQAQTPAPAPGPRLVVTYVEATAAATKSLSGKLAAYAAAQRKADGAPQVLVLSQIGRANRMVVLEGWDKLDSTPGGDTAGTALQTAAAGDIQAPADRRANVPFTPFLKSAPAGALHMVMHVDVIPDGAASAATWLKAQAVSVMAAHGALGFEAGTQTDRPNHFAVHEVWATRADYDAYAASAPAQELRRQISTVKGAPFDDIFYTATVQARASARSKAK